MRGIDQCLIECASTLTGTTEADDFVFFDGELIIVCDFLTNTDRLFGIDDNLLLSFDRDDSCITIGLK